jgi:hypothetical protein
MDYILWISSTSYGFRSGLLKVRLHETQFLCRATWNLVLRHKYKPFNLCRTSQNSVVWREILPPGTKFVLRVNTPAYGRLLTTFVWREEVPISESTAFLCVHTFSISDLEAMEFQAFPIYFLTFSLLHWQTHLLKCVVVSSPPATKETEKLWVVKSNIARVKCCSFLKNNERRRKLMKSFTNM